MPINEKPLFFYVHSYWGSYVNSLWFGGTAKISEVEKSLTKPLMDSSKAAKKFFSNTLPQEKGEEKRAPSSNRKSKDYDESYTVEEKQFLEKILQESR